VYSEISFQTEMNLTSAMRHEYDRSERLLWIGAFVKVVFYLTTIATAAWSNGFAASLFLILACVGQAFLFISRQVMQDHLSLGARLRRLAMLQNGIGREPTAFETALLPDRVWSATRATADPYYSSRLPKGAKRLVDVTAECAFFSGRIADAAWVLFLFVSVAASCMLVLSLVLIAIFGATQSRLEIVAKCVLIGITFWMTGDLVDISLKYRSVTNSCGRILQECFRLLGEENPSIEDAYVVFHEYDAAVAGAPPMPNHIYRRRDAGLGKIWQEMRSRGISSDAA
jgi:hypothetical protein